MSVFSSVEAQRLARALRTPHAWQQLPVGWWHPEGLLAEVQEWEPLEPGLFHDLPEFPRVLTIFGQDTIVADPVSFAPKMERSVLAQIPLPCAMDSEDICADVLDWLAGPSLWACLAALPYTLVDLYPESLVTAPGGGGGPFHQYSQSIRTGWSVGINFSEMIGDHWLATMSSVQQCPHSLWMVLRWSSVFLPPRFVSDAQPSVLGPVRSISGKMDCSAHQHATALRTVRNWAARAERFLPADAVRVFHPLHASQTGSLTSQS